MFLDCADALKRMVDLLAVAEDVFNLFAQIVELAADAFEHRTNAAQFSLDVVEAVVVPVYALVHAAELVKHDPGEPLS